MPRFLSLAERRRGIFILADEVMVMGFQIEQERWMNYHMKQRRGERLDALRRGHGFGNQLFVEKIWWELVGHFEGLHPEYEVKDWRGRSYFVDFMWIVMARRFIFEIMDFGSHGKERIKYRRDLNRGLFLQAQDCEVFYIALDELKENPTFILNALRNILSPYLSAKSEVRVSGGLYCKIERELMRAAIRRHRVIRPVEAAKELEIHTMTVIKYCRQLVEKGKFRPVDKGLSGRVVAYEYIGSLQGPDLV